LVELLKEGVQESSYVQADETPLQVLNEPGRANEKKSYCWVYRAMGLPLKTSIIFEYHSSRSGEVAENFLKEFKGKLQTDGYSGYNGLRQRKDIEGYGCIAHARRKFTDIVKTVKKVGKAHHALVTIGKLYQIEKEAREKEMNAQQRKALRSEKAKPILKKFKEWLESSINQVPPQSAIGKAINYCINQWPYLEKYSDDGEVEIDTNLVENAIRPLALGRRNWLFAGSVEGAESSCIFFSLLQTCRANEIEPYAYFKVILSEVVNCETKEDYKKLLPQFIDREKLKEAYL
jgi:transposase